MTDNEVRKLPAVSDRVETGPVQFGNDWPGIFIRGDNAFALAMEFDQFFHEQPYPPTVFIHVLKSLRSLLVRCVVGPLGQQMERAKVLTRCTCKSYNEYAKNHNRGTILNVFKTNNIEWAVVLWDNRLEPRISVLSDLETWEG